jgi:hypothetical protein
MTMDLVDVWTDAGRATALHPWGGYYIIATYSTSSVRLAHAMSEMLQFAGWRAEVRPRK